MGTETPSMSCCSTPLVSAGPEKRTTRSGIAPALGSRFPGSIAIQISKGSWVVRLWKARAEVRQITPAGRPSPPGPDLCAQRRPHREACTDRGRAAQADPDHGAMIDTAEKFPADRGPWDGGRLFPVRAAAPYLPVFAFLSVFVGLCIYLPTIREHTNKLHTARLTEVRCKFNLQQQ